MTNSATGPTGGSSTNRTVRIGDQERDRAVDCLREHVAAGRLDQAEFEQRMETALTARYAADLEPIFVDLPAPRPDLPTARPERESAPRIAPDPQTRFDLRQQSVRTPAAIAGWRAATTIVWAAAIIVVIASGWHLWWLILLPLVMGGGCGRRQRRAMDDRRMHVRMQRLNHRHW